MSTRKPSTSVFLDTSAFIPMLLGSHKLHRKLHQHLKSINASIGIDAVVLSEYLVGLNDSVDKDKLIETLTKEFKVSSFDPRVAKVCAELFRILKAKGLIPSTPTERQITKVDIMIMASAIVCRAHEFIFEDKHFTAYPEALPESICGYSLPKFVRISKLPDVLVQTSFEEIRNDGA